MAPSTAESKGPVGSRTSLLPDPLHADFPSMDTPGCGQARHRAMSSLAPCYVFSNWVLAGQGHCLLGVFKGNAGVAAG